MENKKLEKFENEIKGKKIAVIGIGVSNIPLIDYLYEKKAEVTIFDDREKANAAAENLKKYAKDIAVTVPVSKGCRLVK